MPCVYILKSLKDGNQYIGSTPDLNRRFEQHQKGEVISTKNRRPLIMRGYRETGTLVEARMLEKSYKQSHDRLLRDIRDGKIVMVDI